MSNNSFYELTTGHKFETEFTGTLSCIFNKKGIASIVATTGTELDTFQGTDAILDEEVRIDWTANFSGKDHLAMVASYKIKTHLGWLRFGIRTANNTAEFDQPVVVVGIDMMAGTLRQEMDAFFETIEKNYSEILDNIWNTWFDYNDMVEAAC